MSKSFSFTSESVSEGHPDKVADQISDAMLDAILAVDPRGRVACETLVKTGVVIVAGEVTTSAWVDVEALVRKTVLDIGYDTSDMGFDGASCGVLNIIGKQSPDIAQGVDRKDERKQGAGDQGLMFGYATNETDVLMPAPITLAHRLVKRQAQVRKNGKLPWLRPDAKSQVTLRYEDDKPVGLEAVVLSTQHQRRHQHQDAARSGHGGDPEAGAAGQVDRQAHQVPHQSHRPLRHRRSGRRLRAHRPQDHRRHLRRLRAPWRRRVLGQGSLEGRPLGRLCGALRGQEHRRRGPRASAARCRCPTRSASPSRPRSWSRPSAPASCRTRGSTQIVRAHFDLTPFGLREMLDLARPIYQKTASYGHFGRKEEEFSWERTDKADSARRGTQVDARRLKPRRIQESMPQ